MNDAPLSSSSIGQIALTVRAIQPALAFYRDVLGLPFLFEAPPSMAFFGCGGVRLMIGQGENAGTGTIVYFRVADIQAAASALAARGVTFRAKPHRVVKMPDHELWLAFFEDPDANVLALMSEVRA